MFDSYVIQYFHMIGLSPINDKAELDSSLGKSASLFTTIKTSVTEILRGPTICQDEHHSGRPNEVTTPKMVNKLTKWY